MTTRRRIRSRTRSSRTGGGGLRRATSRRQSRDRLRTGSAGPAGPADGTPARVRSPIPPRMRRSSSGVRETEELYLRILSVPLLLQFGRSALGKTSLLQAGLFPTLRRKPFLPVMIRLNDPRESLTDAVARSIRESVPNEGVEPRDQPARACGNCHRHHRLARRPVVDARAGVRSVRGGLHSARPGVSRGARRGARRAGHGDSAGAIARTPGRSAPPASRPT